ncbi:MAG: DUF4857 domain-containing protein [Marinilabiliales bacterium]|nr:DUF4857 domain-containing protein [Marinilabiliales bacterium]
MSHLKQIRYIPILLTILVGAWLLPQGYWMVFGKPIPTPFIRYSCLEKTFLVMRQGTPPVRKDIDGKNYTREGFEQALPTVYFMQLATAGTLPDSLLGKEVNVRILKRSSSVYKYQLAAMCGPQPTCFPLFESASGRANLEMPDDFFTLGNRMEFIRCNDNQVDEEKSRRFGDALLSKGFAFPARIIAGLPLLKKSCDEGYLITDAKDQLFHLKMEKGQPYVRKVALPPNTVFKWIECVDFPDKKYYACLITRSNEICLLLQDTYEFVKLPVSGFIPEKEEMRLFSDLFHYTVQIEGEHDMRLTVLDNAFQPVSRYAESWQDKYQRPEGTLYKWLFPFALSLQTESSRYVTPTLRLPSEPNFLVLIFVLLSVEWLLIRRSHRSVKGKIIDLLIVALSGIFGFVAIHIFPKGE